MKTKAAVTLGIKTSDGTFLAHYSENGLAALDFPGGSKSSPSFSTNVPKVRGWHELTANAVQRTLDGKAPGRLPPLDCSRGTAFQQKVWAALRQISTGETETYAQIAASLGAAKAARAVGSACGANPIPLLIPCHRVVAANGKIGGFSGGPGWKEKLLRREKVLPLVKA
jgi:O-6-methylguanine DNA methyltransferase